MQICPLNLNTYYLPAHLLTYYSVTFMLVLFKLHILDYRKFQVAQKENTAKVDAQLVVDSFVFKRK